MSTPLKLQYIKGKKVSGLVFHDMEPSDSIPGARRMVKSLSCIKFEDGSYIILSPGETAEASDYIINAYYYPAPKKEKP